MTGAPASSGTRVYLHTLGCPKNDADSSSLARRLAAAGVALVGDPEEASHILLNTCGFTQEAKEESIGAILGATDAYPAVSVLVMGCLVERYRAELTAEIPEVQGWFGLGDQAALVSALGSGSGKPAAPLRGEGRSFAYVKVSDGCDHPCAFCAIPAIKGSYRGISADGVLAEATAALEEGARELVLVGQDTAAWTDGAMGLPELVDRLAADDRIRWLRLLYLQPEHVDEALLHLLATHEKLVRYLDIPFQHASPRVLRRMARRGDGAAYLALLDRARELMPDVSVRSTFIVGFPGETEEDFEELLDFVERAEFTHAGAFVYSPEEGTPAARLRPRVPADIARERLSRLSGLLLDLAEARNQTLVGMRTDVMVDELMGSGNGWGGEAPEGVVAVGRTPRQAPEIDGVTYLEGPLPSVRPGDVVPALVGEAAGYDLVARWDGP